MEGARRQTRSSDIPGGRFRESVTTQQCGSFVVVTSSAAASAFICTITGMQRAALGTENAVMDDIRTRAALRVPSTPTSRAQRGGVRRWTSAVRVLRQRHRHRRPKEMVHSNSCSTGRPSAARRCSRLRCHPRSADLGMGFTAEVIPSRTARMSTYAP